MSSRERVDVFVRKEKYSTKAMGRDPDKSRALVAGESDERKAVSGSKLATEAKMSSERSLWLAAENMMSSRSNGVKD